MTNRKKKAVLDCCCGTCLGCCLPIDYTQPAYPGGVLQNITAQISAPSCPEIDGDSFILTPSAPTNPQIGTCGACAVYIYESIQILGTRPSPLLYCSTTPCSIFLCFRLTCLADVTPATGLDECCGRLRLWIGCSEQMIEDDGTQPGGLGGSACGSWRKVSPTQCSCLGGGGGFAARFPLGFTTTGPLIETGPCAGEQDKCTPNCSLAGAEIII